MRFIVFTMPDRMKHALRCVAQLDRHWPVSAPWEINASSQPFGQQIRKVADEMPEDEHFCLMLDDLWVDTPMTGLMWRAAIQDMLQGADSVRFRGGPPEICKGQHGHGWLLSDSPYQMSLWPQLVRAGFLSQWIRKKWNPWQCEIEGTKAIRDAGAKPKVRLTGFDGFVNMIVKGRRVRQGRAKALWNSR